MVKLNTKESGARHLGNKLNQVKELIQKKVQIKIYKILPESHPRRRRRTRREK